MRVRLQTARIAQATTQRDRAREEMSALIAALSFDLETTPVR